jgi:formyltetrahydrofolate-dependent phosphoribosylglycinamide formyltransferase
MMGAKLAVLISGGGTNLQAILDACGDGRLDAEVAVVVSNKRKAFGLNRAREAGVPTEVMNLRKFMRAGGSRDGFDAELADRVRDKYAPDLVVLAGWMLILSPAFLDRFPGRVLNLHPALPGQFAGTHAIQRAHDAFQAGEITHTGVMVHWVVPEVDAGPTVAVAQVQINPGEPVEELEERIHRTEHRLMVEAIGEVISKEA